MFLRLVLSNRHPFAPSALPDFFATMGVSDFRQTPLSSSLFRLVRECAPARVRLLTDLPGYHAFSM